MDQVFGQTAGEMVEYYCCIGQNTSKVNYLGNGMM